MAGNLCVQALTGTDQPRITNFPVAFIQQLKKYFSTYADLQLFGKFCVQNFESIWSLHSPFVPHFWIDFFFLPIASTLLTQLPHVSLLWLAKKLSWKIAAWRLLFLTYFWVFTFTKYCVTHDPIWEEQLDFHFILKEAEAGTVTRCLFL